MKETCSPLRPAAERDAVNVLSHPEEKLFSETQPVRLYSPFLLSSVASVLAVEFLRYWILPSLVLLLFAGFLYWRSLRGTGD